MRHSTFVACTAVFAGVAVVLFLGAGSTRAQTVKYSEDGRAWASTLRSTFFGNEIRWVPGDSRESRFHVFNDTDRDGRLWLSLDSDNPAFLRALSISIGDGELVESCAWIDIEAGEKKRIDAEVSMAAAAGNDTRTSIARIDLIVQWDNSNNTECPEFSGARMDTEGAQP